MTRKVWFVSTGSKFDEARKILARHGVTVVQVSKRLTELQVEDVEVLLKDKVLQAFEITGRPVFVEHTGLYLDALNGLPGGLTRLFWERLEEERFCKLFGGSRVTAKTAVAYCDTRTIHPLITGEATGRVADAPAGDGGFAWDRVFIPDDSEAAGRTYAQIGPDKDEISMRRKALDAFAEFLKERG
jgi:XTP/dITP diphosphohydrolase